MSRKSFSTLNQAIYDIDSRYISDNALGIVTEFDNLVTAFRKTIEESEKKAITIILATVISACSFTFLVSIFLFWRPLYLLIRERAKIFSLFKEIPKCDLKGVIVQLEQATKGKNTEALRSMKRKSDSKAKTNHKETKKIKVQKVNTIAISFLVVMVFLLVYALAIMGFSVSCLNGFFTPIDIHILRGKERSSLRRIHYLPIVDEIQDDLLNKKLNYRDNSNFVETVIAQIYDIKKQVSTLDSGGKYEGVDTVKPLRSEFQCTNALGTEYPIGYCEGLDMLDQIFIKSLRAFISAEKRLNRTSTSTSFRFMDKIGRELIYQTHKKAEQAFLSYYLNLNDNQQIVLYILLFLSYPIAIIGVIFTEIKLLFLKTEQQQLFKLFLMMPIKSLENPRIKSFLTTGKVDQKDESDEDKNLDLQIEATLTKTERILQAAADAIIVFDGYSLKTEVFNTAAEKLFGIGQYEAIGKLITDFLPEEVIELQLTKFDELQEQQGSGSDSSSDDGFYEKKEKKKKTQTLFKEKGIEKNCRH